MFEIAAAGKPSILVPSPNVTANHQTANAEHFALGGAAVMVEDADLTPTRLRQEVAANRAALYNYRRRNAMRQLENTSAIRDARRSGTRFPAVPARSLCGP